MPEHTPKLLTSSSCQSELHALCTHSPGSSPGMEELSMHCAGSAGSLGGEGHLCDCLGSEQALFHSVSACSVYHALVTSVLDTVPGRPESSSRSPTNGL